jgi:hypothetical protein
VVTSSSIIFLLGVGVLFLHLGAVAILSDV